MNNYITVDSGEQIHYFRRACESSNQTTSCQPILLIHGNFFGLRCWEPLIEHIPLNFDVYSLDLRGFGKSTNISCISSFHDFAKDSISFLNKLGLKNVALIGWSMGAAVAVIMSSFSPGIIASITLVGGVRVDGIPFIDKQNKRITEKLVIKQKLHKFHKMLTSFDQQAIQNHLLSGMILNSNMDVGLQRNYLDVTALLATSNYSFEAMTIKCPITIVHGTNDQVIPFNDALFNFEFIRKYNLMTKFHEIQQGSHAPHIDHPKELAKIISNNENYIYAKL